MTFDELLDLVGGDPRHVLGPGLPIERIHDWQRRWPHHPLPADLVALLRRVDGIHLFADRETGRAYAGIAPLAEWDLAGRAMYGAGAASVGLSDRYLALTYHADGAAFAVLDVDRGRYFLMDSCGPDETCPIGEAAGDLLDWIWASRA